MEAHGSHVAPGRRRTAGRFAAGCGSPCKVFEKVGVDGLTVLHAAIDAVRRGGTVSVVGVYGGAVDPMPMMDMFDKQSPVADGSVPRQALDRRPHAAGHRYQRPLGVTSFATHHLPLEQAPHGYDIFRDKADGCLKVVLQP